MRRIERSTAFKRDYCQTRLPQVQSDIPAMIVTADYSMEAAREAAVYGLELLKKPVKPAEMRSLLSFLLA